MDWWKLSEEDRIKKVYSKYTIEDFWNWWSNENRAVMEVRIKNYKIIQETAKTFSIPYSLSGVYVWDWQTLKKVILFVRNKTTMWFGINPRKKNWVSNKNNKSWKGWGGGLNFVENINFILIDIDRVNKQGVATSEDLKACDKMCELILERLEKYSWNKSFCKICSGNGVQLLLKLDVPIRVSTLVFDDTTLQYEMTQEFEQIKNLVREGIGKEMRKFIRRYKQKLNVEVDRAVFDMSRVGALPYTKNFKYDKVRWRAIIELKDEINEGLSDYVLSKIDDIKMFKNKNVFTKTKATSEYIIKKGKFLKHPLVRFLLENEFPAGGINNTLWYELKILLRDSNVDLRSKEFVDFHRTIIKKHNRTFTLNIPDKNHSFNVQTINNYCINNMLVSPYELWPKRNKKVDMKLNGITFNDYRKIVGEKIVLEEDTTIMDDMQKFSELLIPGQLNNRDKFAGFISALMNKFGEEKTKYFFDIVFEKYFCYK